MKKILPLMAMLLMVAIILPSCSDDDVQDQTIENYLNQYMV